MNWDELVAPARPRASGRAPRRHLDPARGQELGHARSLVLAVLVVDQHLAGERRLPDRTSQPLTTRSHASPKKPALGSAAGRDDDDVRPERQHVVALGVAVEPDVDAGELDLALQPAGDAQDLAAAVEAGGEVDLPAQPVGRLQQHHVAPRRRHPRCLQPGRAAADHDDAPPRAVAGDRVRHGALAAGGRVVDAERLAADIDPVDVAGPTQGRIRSSSPRITLATMCGSAMWARVMPTMSAKPSAMTWRAVLGSVIRVAWNTGRPVAGLKARACST